MMRIALMVANPLRDLSGMTLLAMELANRGHKTFLIPNNRRRLAEIGALRPDFVLLNNLRRTKQNFVQDLLDTGIKVGVLDSEGGVFSSWEWYGDSLDKDPAVRRGISCFCAWGEAIANQAVDRNWYADEQIHVTGHPRFDFYAPQFSEVQFANAPDPRQYPKPLILINGNFSACNPGLSTTEQMHQTIMKIRNYSSSHATYIQETKLKGMHQLCQAVNGLAAKFPECDFIYRPHPFECVETYNELLTKNANIQVIREGEVSGWLKIAKCVIQRGCTTAIEAGLLNIPVLSPSWIAVPEEIDIIERVSVQCGDQEDLERNVQSAIQNTFVYPASIPVERINVVRDFFCASDGNAYRRVADVIEKTAGTVDINIKKCEAWCKNGEFGGKSPLSKRLSQLITGKNHITEKTEKVEKLFDSRQVQDIAQVIQQRAVGLSSRLRILSSKESGEYYIDLPVTRSVAISKS